MADKKFTQLTAAVALAGADLLAIAQGGTSKTITGAVLLTYVGTAYFPNVGGALTGAVSLTNSVSGSAGTNSFSIAATWNTTGTPTALNVSVTNTTSNAGLLMAVSVDGSRKFSIDASGTAEFAGAVNFLGAITGSTTLRMAGSVNSSDSTHSLEVSPLWNTTGAPVALYLNPGGLASGSASLIEAYYDEGLRFKVGKNGDTFADSLKTTAPGGASGAGVIRFGKKVDATVAFATTRYVELEVDGTLYKLALAN